MKHTARKTDVKEAQVSSKTGKSFLEYLQGKEAKEAIKPLPEFVVALHIRHTNPRDNGKEDQGEEECLRNVLEWFQPPNTQCVVHIASDREMTLNRMLEYIDTRGHKLDLSSTLSAII